MPSEDLAWYHGSSLKLQVLRAGCTITRDRDVARIFSHEPTIVANDETGRYFHNGKVPGFLYRVEGVSEADVYAHPRTTMAAGVEWLTRKELRLSYLEDTRPRSEELLDPADEEDLRRRAAERLGERKPTPPTT